MKIVCQYFLILSLSSFVFAVEKSALSSSFEEFPVGDFTALNSTLGRWTVSKGKAAISEYFKSGRQCLHLKGGQENIVDLTIAPDMPNVFQLSFWAERFTGKNPFTFRIMAKIKSDWNEIYDGDKQIKVGRSFHHFIRIELPEQKISALRFLCISPADTGILIDDLRLHQPSPMKIQKVTTSQWVGPVLIRKAYNPVLAVKVEADGVLSPKRVTGLMIRPDGTTDINDIESVRIFYTGSKDRFSLESEFGSAAKPAEQMSFRGDQALEEGVNYFWVSYTLKESADLFHKADASCVHVQFDSEQIIPDPISPPIIKRIGYNIRNAGDDGVAAYRIPGLAATNRGTLIAVYDIRRHGMGDLPGDIDVGMSRSTDGGQRWEPMNVIMDMGSPHKENGIGDPCILVDRANNTIWVAALWSKGNRSWFGSGPGLSPEETGQFVLVNSRDDGKTWSEPVSITSQIEDPKWRLLFQGPGNGITLRDGTLIFPAQFKDEHDMPHSTLIYSKDHGQTWRIGTGAKPDTTEAQIVELNDGSLMLNMRDNRGGFRSICTTGDLGKTWQEHPTSRAALPESVCMASFIRFSSVTDGDKRDILLFSNPATTRGRYNMTIKASLDEGMTWPDRYHKLFFEPDCAGYSCMAKADETSVGILYEGGDSAHLIFEKFHIDEIVGD